MEGLFNVSLFDCSNGMTMEPAIFIESLGFLNVMACMNIFICIIRNIHYYNEHLEILLTLMSAHMGYKQYISCDL